MTSPVVDTVVDANEPPVIASQQDGTYPRPQLVRPHWTSLDGRWSFRYDDGDTGVAERWFETWPQDGELGIRVPFPPESPASGIGDTDYHPVVWYRRAITPDERAAAGSGERVILHFGAVDYRADVWVDGSHVGSHEGGHTPFSFDVTDAIRSSDPVVVVRAFDDPLDVGQPRGKQDWEREQHVIWYDRTTGIWQTVWLEVVPALSIAHVEWDPDVAAATVRARVELRGRGSAPVVVGIELDLGGQSLARIEVEATSDRLEIDVPIARLRNGQDVDQLTWSPETPRLVDARVSVGAFGVDDVVSSYLGFRQIDISRGSFVLNHRPTIMRSVLSQGYWPESHLAAPSVDALRREVELILELGFNAARLHQKLEDPRLLFWADRLGLLLWVEMPSAYEFSPTSVQRLTAEWTEAVRRDRSHPSVVAWVPINESWGVQHIKSSAAQQAFARSMADLTRALDPSRPVISNDGWEHVNSDLLTIHDYEGAGDVVEARYLDEAAIERMVRGVGPAGRRLQVGDGAVPTTVMLTEFGGIKFAPGEAEDSWGYTTADDPADFEERLRSLLSAVHRSRVLAGFCYTQLTDTGLEQNGLLTADRRPKLPMDTLRAIIEG